MRPAQLTWKARGELWMRLGLRFFLTAALLWSAAQFGRFLLSLSAPFLFAFVTAAVLNPPIHWLRKKLGLSRQLLTLLMLLGVLGILGAGVGFLAYTAGQEALDLVQNWDLLLESLHAAADSIEQLFARVLTLVPPQITQRAQTLGEELFIWAGQTVPEALTALASRAGQKAMGLPAFFVSLIVYLMATFFLTVDYPELYTRAARHVDKGVVRFFSQIRSTALGAFGGYLKAQVLLSTGVFFILLAGFLLIGQPYALLLALGLSILDFIPILGSGTVMVPWALIALFSRQLPTAVELMVIWGLIVLYRRVMEPKFVGDQTGLSPFLSLVSIYVGMKLGGVPGMILGPILLLVVINLISVGLFEGLRLDLTAAFRDICAILSQRPEDPS